MAPGIAPTAYAVASDVMAQIAQSMTARDGSGGSGGGDGQHHHYHGGGHSSTGASDSDSFTSSDSSSQFGGSHSKEGLVSQFLSGGSQDQRMGVLVTTSFSIVAAMIVIYSIMYDTYRVKPGDLYSRAQRRSGVCNILPTTDVFPFITAVAIIVQGFIFIGIQSDTLDSFEVSGCRLTSELIWPVVWLVPLIVLVFSIETTIRALRQPLFQTKARFMTAICLSVVVLLLLGLWLSAFFMPSLDVCPGSLSWWTLHYSKIAVVLVSGIIFSHIISGTVIIVQLMKTGHMDEDQRIAASRIVYTLLVNTIIMVLVLPFWIQIVQGQLAIESSKVADIGLTLNGMLFGALHLILRANAGKFAIRAKNATWAPSMRMRFFGRNDNYSRSFISQPFTESKQAEPDHWLSEKIEEAMRSPDSASSSVWSEPVARSATVDGPISFPMETPWNMATRASDEYPLPQEPAQVATPMRPRYSVFPSQREANLPRASEFPPRPPPKDSWMSAGSASSDQSDQYIELPEPLFAPRLHERKESTMTSATVEIGIRLSSALEGMEDEAPVSRPDSMEPPMASRFSEATATDSEPPRSPVPQIHEPEAAASPAGSSSTVLQPPPTGARMGIGALGLGPKGGLRPLPNQPPRSSPLANVSITPPTPPQSDTASQKSPGSSGQSSPGSTNGGNTLSPSRPVSPAFVGLPTSPKPQRSPFPQLRVKSPLAGPAQPPTITSATLPDSPTEWPQWSASQGQQ